MRKFLMILLSLFLFIGITACIQNKAQTEDEKPSITEEKKEVPKDADTPEEEPDLASDTGNQDENNQPDPPSTGENEEPLTIYANNSFKDVTVTEQGANIVVTGKARVFEGTFQYVILVDGNMVSEDHYQTAGAPEWGDFELTFSKEELLPESELELYYYSAEDGSKTDTLKLELINESSKALYANNSFRVMEVNLSENKIVIIGYSRVFEGTFQYALKVNDNVVEENYFQTAGAPSWGSFELVFSKDLIPYGNGYLELFHYSAKDGSKLDVIEIPLKKQQK